MSFQVLDANGKAITMEQLDLEAATLWGKEVHIKKWAWPDPVPEKFDSPSDSYRYWSGISNWFDRVMWQCHFYKLETWDEIRAELLKPYYDLKDGATAEQVTETIKAMPGIWGYIDLVDHWKSKGYTPKYVSDKS